MCRLKLTRDSIEGIPREDLEHFARSLVQNLNACTHMVVEYGENDHHKVEAAQGVLQWHLGWPVTSTVEGKVCQVPRGYAMTKIAIFDYGAGNSSASSLRLSATAQKVLT